MHSLGFFAVKRDESLPGSRRRKIDVDDRSKALNDEYSATHYKPVMSDDDRTHARLALEAAQEKGDGFLTPEELKTFYQYTKTAQRQSVESLSLQEQRAKFFWLKEVKQNIKFKCCNLLCNVCFPLSRGLTKWSSFLGSWKDTLPTNRQQLISKKRQ